MFYACESETDSKFYNAVGNQFYCIVYFNFSTLFLSWQHNHVKFKILINI